MDIAQIQDLALYTVVDNVRGRLVSCKNRFTGDGQYGKYSLQTGELKDQSGTITVVFKDRQDMQPYEGEVIQIKSKTYKKNLSGLKLDEYKGTTQLSSTVGSEVSLLDKNGEGVIKKIGNIRDEEDIPSNSNNGGGSSNNRSDGEGGQRQKNIELQSARRDASLIVGSMIESNEYSFENHNDVIEEVEYIAGELYHWKNGDTEKESSKESGEDIPF